MFIQSNNSLYNSNFLADYASIKNGSYGKLMKSYYSKNANDSVNSIVNSNKSKSVDDAKTITNIKSNAESLKKSASALSSRDLFKEKDITTTDEDGKETTTKGYDVDAIYKAVKSFADSYNGLLSATSSSNNSNINRAVSSLTQNMSINSKKLSDLGITISGDGKLSVDEESFKKGNMTTAKSLFSGPGSIAYNAETKASYIELYAKNDSAKGAGSFYSSKGSFYDSYFGSGSNYNSIF